MNRVNLARVDLKLLATLQVLLEERNVTRAAERLFVSQPAMSKSLQKLKQIFADPLFERTAYGLIPTPKAEEIAIKLPQLLEQFQDLVDGEEFDPSTYKGRFHLALPQLVSELSLPLLTQHLNRQAPNASIRAADMPGDYSEQLATGKLDFVIHRASTTPTGVLSFPISNNHNQGLCLMRKEHPLAQKTQLTVEEYLAFPHVQVYFPGMTDDDTGIIDQVLRKQQLTRHVLLATTHLTAALESLISTDCLMVGPSNLLQSGPYRHQLAGLPFPKELPFPHLDLVLLQHRRTENSKPHQWLRDILLSTIPPG